MKSFLTNLLTSDRYSQLSIATGYWDLPGMLEMLPAFEHFLSVKMFNEIRFLIGEEPKIRASQLDTAFPEKYLREDLKDLPFQPEYRNVVAFLCRCLDEGKIKIKLYKGGFLHAKCYIIGLETENAVGVIGSSNFTQRGLLGNTELNDVEYDHRIVNYLPRGDQQDPSHRSWFEKLWNSDDSVDWNRQFKMDILGVSQFGALTYSPYEIYIRILYEIYGDDIEIEEKLKTEARMETRVDLTLFQEESVRKVLTRLNNSKIGMCLIGDSVGLGKSYIAKKVIEECGYFKRQNVVVVCPASLRDDWMDHLKDITVNAPVYSITEFSQDNSFLNILQELRQRKQISKRDNAVDLLVIDESHNLKTQGSKSFQNMLQLVTDREYCPVLPKVLMLSATPVNNGIKDLANQILLAKGGDDKFFAPFGIPKILSLFGGAQREFQRKDSEEVFAELYPILNKIMVKRTKHQVKKDFPNALLDGQPIIFPEERLENVLYELDSRAIRKIISEKLRNLEEQNKHLYDFFTQEMTETEEEQEEKEGIKQFFRFGPQDKRRKINRTEFESVFHFIDRAIKGLKLAPYSYLTEKIIKTEGEEIQAKARHSLTGVMKVTLFKSFDSSIFTFRKRIAKYAGYLNNFDSLFFEHKKIVRPEIIQKALLRHEEDEGDEDVLDLILDEVERFHEREKMRAAADVRYKSLPAYMEIDLDDYHTENLRAFIQQDIDIIQLIEGILDNVREDTKLARLKELLKSLKGRKILIFSYFAATIDYLEQELGGSFLQELGFSKDAVAFMKSKTSQNKQNIVHRFSPIAQKQFIDHGLIGGKPELQLLCTTDVLSEGQNLQDCGIIINYDLHWNPIKMVQRNGRINRLGSRFNEIFIYNFRPEDQLDKFLNLMVKLQRKIRIIGASVGIDSSILGEQITERQFGLIESIYSGDRTRQREAIEDLERENDLAFDEVFENDLREFIRQASDVEKESLLNLNFNKWCSLSTLKENQHLMAFNVGSGEFDFIRAESGRVIKEDNHLKVLRQIRSLDRERQKEQITFSEKQALLDKAAAVFNAEQAARDVIGGANLEEFLGVPKTAGGSLLAKHKETLLQLLQENADRYSVDNRNRLISLLTSKNLALDNRLRGYLKRYDQEISLDLLDTLAILSAHIIKDQPPEQAPTPVLWFGYYAK